MKNEQNRVFLGYMRNSAGIIVAHTLEAPGVNMIYHEVERYRFRVF